MKKPNFFIIGARKCGTTSLANWLAEHPQVFLSAVKEPHFYCHDFHAGLQVGRAEYDDLFAKVQDRHRAVGEASTSYLYSRVAIPTIEEELPGAKYIVMVRNPVEMAYALHEQVFQDGVENIQDFATAWELSEQRAQGQAVPRWCREPKFLDYKSICLLGEQVARLFTLVSRERVLVLVLDDVKENPRREYLRVLRFLSLEDDGRMTFPVLNKAKENRFPAMQRAARPIIETFIFLKGKTAIPGISRLTIFLHRFYYHIFRRINTRPGRVHPFH